jgi:hypothetical protein
LRFWKSKPLLAILAATALIRLLVIVLGWQGLRDDPDAYDRIAQAMARTGTLGVAAEDGTVVPTAFRPPLYPALLAIIRSVMIAVDGEFLDPASPRGQIVLRQVAAVLHLLLGLLTVAATYFAACRWLTQPPPQRPLDDPDAKAPAAPRPNRAGLTAALAAMLVAIDPILLQSSVRLMTETLATALAAVALSLWPRLTDSLNAGDIDSPMPSNGKRIAWQGVWLGAVLGLAYLCRPTFVVWTFLLVTYLSGWGLVGWGVKRFWLLPHAASPRRVLGVAGVITVVAGLFLGGWTLRNLRQFGHPIWATSHGGYTLLLGNNPPFFDYVRTGPFGIAWDPSEFFESWRRRELADPRQRPFWTDGPDSAAALAANPRWAEEQPPPHDEVAQDRLAYETAKAAIRADLPGFLQACVWRWTRLLGPMPQQPTPQAPAATTNNVPANAKPSTPTGRLPTAAIALVTLYYSGFTLLVLAGIWRIGRRLLTPRYAAAIALLLSLFAVHTFYWSNLRMRAPAVPALAIFAAIGLCRPRLSDETNASASTDRSSSPGTAI